VADDVVVGLVAREHGRHRAHVVRGVTPVTLGFEVAQAKFGVEARFDARDAVGDLAGDELEAASRRLVIEEYARRGVQDRSSRGSSR